MPNRRRKVRSSYNARSFQSYGGAAYGIDVGNARFEPFATLPISTSTDGFTESGGAAALAAPGDIVNTTDQLITTRPSQ